MTTLAAHFERKDPAVTAIYQRLLVASRKLGPVAEEPKKTSIHLVRGSAFAGVATRRTALILTLKSTSDIRSPRIVKRQRQSPRRWYLDVRLEKPADVDRELAGWLKASYALSE